MVAKVVVTFTNNQVCAATGYFINKMEKYLMCSSVNF